MDTPEINLSEKCPCEYEFVNLVNSDNRNENFFAIKVLTGEYKNTILKYNNPNEDSKGRVSYTLQVINTEKELTEKESDDIMVLSEIILVDILKKQSEEDTN